MNKHIRVLYRIPKIIWHAAKRFYFENYSYRASSLAFVSVLAIVPIFSVLFYIVTLLPASKHLIELTDKYIFSNFFPDTTAQIQQYINQFSEHAALLPIFSIAFSIFTAISMILTIEDSLNAIWRCHSEQRTVLSRVFCWLIILLLPFIIGATSLLTEYIFSVFDLKVGLYLLVSGIDLLISISIFAIIFLVVPNTKISWQDGLLGGIIAACLFELARQLFAYYINYFTNYTIIYGALAIIPVFLVWIYFSWSLFLYSGLILKAKTDLAR